MQLDWPEPPQFPTLLSGQVHVWAVSLDSLEPAEANLAGLLSTDERARAESFLFDESRRVFVSSRIALRSLVARYLGATPHEVVFEIRPDGKPQLAGGELRFDLAHSGSLVLVAVTRDVEVGVDVERRRAVDRRDEIAARNFHPTEIAALRAAAEPQRDETFLRSWVRKEAVLKAIGSGLQHSLATFDTERAAEQAGLVTMVPAMSAAQRFWLRDLHPVAGYLAAVATCEDRLECLEFGFSWARSQRG